MKLKIVKERNFKLFCASTEMDVVSFVLLYILEDLCTFFALVLLLILFLQIQYVPQKVATFLFFE